jgi:hypothetical protein
MNTGSAGNSASCLLRSFNRGDLGSLLKFSEYFGGAGYKKYSLQLYSFGN